MSKIITLHIKNIIRLSGSDLVYYVIVVFFDYALTVFILIFIIAASFSSPSAVSMEEVFYGLLIWHEGYNAV